MSEEPRNEGHARPSVFERLAQRLTAWTGSTTAFVVAVAVVVGWAASGPVFGYSESWQLVINTGTTIATFLMVFLIQRTQNKDSLALHLKLNELIATKKGASNRLVNVEDLSEDELWILHRHFAELARLASKDSTLFTSHSIDEARGRHRGKREANTAGEGSPEPGPAVR